MPRKLIPKTLEQKITHNCDFLSKRELCSVYKGQNRPFDYSNHSECKNPKIKDYYQCKIYQEARNKMPNILAGLTFNIRYY